MIDLEVIYRNKKTGNYYIVLGTVINATNAQDGQVMVKYRSSEGGDEYVREQSEFLLKFEPRSKT